MAVVPEQTIWNDLTGGGASNIQAAGIMGNMQNESAFDPEAIGDQGTSFGLVQQHGAYSYLVTGNTQKDLAAQIKNILPNIGLASGSTAAAAGGSFAANFEKCVGCQPGGAQYAAREQNATNILAMAQSGNWQQGGTGTTGTTSSSSLPCGLFSPQNCVINAVTGWTTDFWRVPLQIIEAAFGGFGLKEMIQRAGLIVMGAIFVIIGLYVLAHPSSPSSIMQDAGMVGGTSTGGKASGRNVATGSAEASEAIEAAPEAAVAAI